MKFLDKSLINRAQLVVPACGQYDFPIPAGACVTYELYPIYGGSLFRISDIESYTPVLPDHLIQNIHVLYFCIQNRLKALRLTIML